MPFILKKGAQTFQRLMDSVLRGIDWDVVYLHDILVVSRNKEEYLNHLRSVFKTLAAAGMVIQCQK
jgi:hypothetical protein